MGIVSRVGDPVLRIGRVRRWQWPWVVIGTLVVFALTLPLVGAGVWLEVVLAAQLGEEPSGGELTPGHVASFAGFAVFGLSLVLAVAVAMWLVHGQDPRLALSPERRFIWRHFGKAALAYLIVLLAATLIAVIRYPGDIRLLPRTFDHLPWLLLGALVILPQAFGEDYLFKGYLVRVMGALVPIRSFVVVVVAALFTSAHSINDDVRADLAFNLIQFMLGEVVVLWLYVRTASLALATGVHWMNNVWAFCIVSTEPGQSDALSLFRAVDRILLEGGTRLTDPLSWIGTAVLLALLTSLLAWRRSPLFIEPYHVPLVEDQQAALHSVATPGGSDQRG
jgi:membrane protease YdiL (CAAX protease family)